MLITEPDSAGAGLRQGRLVIISWQGSEYDFDADFMSVSITEFREIKRKLKLTLAGILEGMQELDPDACTAVYWLVMRSDGKHDDLVLGDNLVFDLLPFMQAFSEAEEPEEAEPDPTPDGSLPDTSTLALTGSAKTT